MPTGKQKRIKKRLDKRQAKVDESRATFGSKDPHLGKFDRRLNRLRRTVNQAEKQGMNVSYDATDASGEGRKSSINMNYSPNKMESNKQEKYNLMHDNPVAKHASWMSKHSKSALHMGHSPAEMGHDSPAKNIDPKKFLEGTARIATAAVTGGLSPEAAKEAYKGVKNVAKKVGKGVKKVAKRIKHDMTGGFEHARKRRQMRGGN